MAGLSRPLKIHSILKLALISTNERRWSTKCIQNKLRKNFSPLPCNVSIHRRVVFFFRDFIFLWWISFIRTQQFPWNQLTVFLLFHPWSSNWKITRRRLERLFLSWKFDEIKTSSMNLHAVNNHRVQDATTTTDD